MTDAKRRAELVEIHRLLEELQRRRRENKLATLFPDSGQLSRFEYPKFMEFFEAGAHILERAMLAGNRCGKSIAGGFEDTLHLTGEYPDWWEGRRFDEPVRMWACGDTAKTVRDILQLILLGPAGSFGTGLIPAATLERTWNKSGVPNAIEIAHVKHKSGGISELLFKSYDQGRVSFQGTSQHVIHLDEEPPEDVYTECAMRTMATGGFKGGIILATFTPLNGISEVVKKFLPGGKMW